MFPLYVIFEIQLTFNWIVHKLQIDFMHKKNIKKKRLSFLAAFFHKPLFILFIIATLPFLVWGVRQAQTYISFGKNQNEQNVQKLYPQQTTCPTTSSQTYESINPVTPPQRKIQNPENNPEVNISLRGWTEVNEAKQLIDYGGDTDPNPPPSFGSVFAGRIPQVVNTYIINEWDWGSGKGIPGKSATPAWPVHLIGLAASPGEPILGLAAGRKVYGDFTLMVLYASPNSITFTHSNGDVAPPNDDGYPIYFLDICVDPNLLAKYQSDNAGGRNSLPAIRAGQIFGYAKDTEVKVAVRDTGSFMDPRSRKDWWQFGPGPGTPYTPPNIPPTTVPSSPTSYIPIPTTMPATPTLYSSPMPTQIVIPSQRQALPTQIPVTIILPITPTSAPPTATPTPKPIVDLNNTIEGAKSVWTKLITQLVQFIKIILP